MSVNAGCDLSDGFGVLELMGHRKRVGRISEVEAFGGKLLRIDVLPKSDKYQGITEYYGHASIYAVTPVTEEDALRLASRMGSYEPIPTSPLAIEDHSPGEATDWDLE